MENPCATRVDIKFIRYGAFSPSKKYLYEGIIFKYEDDPIYSSTQKVRTYMNNLTSDGIKVILLSKGFLSSENNFDELINIDELQTEKQTSFPKPFHYYPYCCKVRIFIKENQLISYDKGYHNKNKELKCIRHIVGPKEYQYVIKLTKYSMFSTKLHSKTAKSKTRLGEIGSVIGNITNILFRKHFLSPKEVVKITSAIDDGELRNKRYIRFQDPNCPFTKIRIKIKEVEPLTESEKKKIVGIKNEYLLM